MTATGSYTDGTTQNLTSQASWTTSSANATVSNTSSTKGLVTGVAVGTAQIKATLNGITGSTTVTVTAAALTSITVTPANPSIADGTTVQLTATGNYTDGTTQNLTNQASWTSANGNATVSNTSPTNGLVTGVAAGTVQIKAALSGKTGSTTVTVTPAVVISITVTPVNPTLIRTNFYVFMHATANFSDGSTQDVTLQAGWTSSNTNVVIVYPHGSVVIAQVPAFIVASGSATVTATYGGKQGTTTFTALPVP
jgi:trimeric autotransporter adhesin